MRSEAPRVSQHLTADISKKIAHQDDRIVECRVTIERGDGFTKARELAKGKRAHKNPLKEPRKKEKSPILI